MEIKLIGTCKLFTLTKNGIEQISIDKVKMKFENSKVIYQLKEGDENQIVVQSLNAKFASIKMLTILNERRRKNDSENKRDS